MQRFPSEAQTPNMFLEGLRHKLHFHDNFSQNNGDISNISTNYICDLHLCVSIEWCEDHRPEFLSNLKNQIKLPPDLTSLRFPFCPEGLLCFPL